MKNHFSGAFFGCLLGIHTLLAGTPLQAGSGELQYWVEAEQRKVYFVYRPELRIQLTKIAADEEFWDQLQIEVTYANPRMPGLIERLQQAHPGFDVVRVIMEKAGGFTLSIPALGIQEEIPAMPGQTGPYLQWTGFVTQAKSAAFRRALQSPDAIRLTAQAEVTVSQTQVTERVELSPDVCSRLVAPDDSIYGVITRYATVLEEIEARTYRYPSTKAALRHSVLESCLELASGIRVESFADLLAMKVAAKPGAMPAGETRAAVPVKLKVPLQMDASITLGEVQP